MKKDYQTKAASAALAELDLPGTVTVAMDDLAETVREGLLASPSGPGCRSCR
ncbi:MAG: hypothetical protein M3P53_00830 [Actinomycetota bacterium]|nr:hypothetical protein [Actinomycetota bacterium]